MQLVHTIDEVRAQVKAWKQEGLSVGLVPTMGYLHDGHKSLIERAVKENDRVVVSDFVNPTQFGENEDLGSYPRDIKRDAALCEAAGVELLFNPTPEEMYYKDNCTFVDMNRLTDVLCGKTFRISSKSFYQVNPVQTEVLYNKAIEFAGLTGKERVIDAYSGIGTIGMVASDNAGEVISVELNGDAVRDAVFNAKQNKVKNIRFYKEDAGDFMVKMASHKEKADVVFMDPPRAGSDKKFLDSLLRLKPKKIVYISCNPETLARDLKHLTGNGYSVRQIQPVDMFPSTGHIETVVLIQRKTM